MSRIENAMEKAAQLRQSAQTAGAAPVVEPRPSAPPSPGGPVFLPYGKLNPVDPFLVNLLQPQSPVAEEYRKLKSALVKMTTGEEFRNCLMVTSSVPCEGKTLTAVNLALSLAQGFDHTVLLVDADLRRPSVHRYLNVEQGPGLAEVLSGEAGLGETIIGTGIGKLSIIRAGRVIDNPAELFSSQRTRAMLQELKSRYPDRYIILDTPPVLPFAEARSLAHLVDGVLFVVMERLAAQANIKEALDSLKGAPLLGVVYNAAEGGALEGRYAHYYGYEKRS